MSKITLNDIDVQYSENGVGNPVVFIHGLAEDHTTWKSQQYAVSQFHSFAYDLRGHGSTSPGQCDGTLSQLGQDLIAFLENVSGQATVIGFSLGGTIALWVAAERPDLVKKLIVLGTSSVVGRAAIQFYETRIGQAADTGSDQFKDALYSDTQAGLFKTHPHFDQIVAARLAAIGTGQGYINAARAMMRLHTEPLTPRLSQIKCPTVVVGAEHDQFCPQKAATIILDALPSAGFLAVPDAGHLMKIDNPDAVDQALLTALSDRIIPGLSR